jgi:transcriptional regulator with XRE-family HTH domain
LGTTHVNVSRWERGITKPHPYFRRRLCQLFGKTETELGLLPSVVGISHDEPREVSSPVFKLTLSHGEEHIVVLLAVEENQLKLIS